MNNLDILRPQWIDYFIALTFLIAERSLDPSTQCGCVVTDKDNTVLSVGYNSPPRGCKDELIPLERPAKYMYMVHAEEAAIANAARSGVSLNGSTFYVNGYSCEKCIRLMINAGAKKIVNGPLQPKCVDEESKKATQLMLDGQDIEFVIYNGKQNAAYVLENAYKNAWKHSV